MMAQILEYDYLMGGSPSERIRTYDDGEAMNQRILEWLDTPEGTVADMPDWGSPLLRFKHEPDSPSIQVMAEMLIFRRLSEDVKGIDIRAVSVQFPEIDLMQISIVHGTGFLERQVAR